MKKRLIAIFLIAALIMTVLPVITFAEKQNDPQVETDYMVEGTNSFGNLLSKDIRSQTAAEEAQADSSYVRGIEIDGRYAEVELQTTESCTLVVAVYTEDCKQMLASGSVAVAAGTDEAEVYIDGEIPEYFMVKVFLIGENDEPLCDAYSTPMYTQQMQELQKLTTNDFEADRILNLDASEDNNFAVYGEDTIVIKPEEGKNTVSEASEGGVYKLENIDDQIRVLQPGDTFAYEYAEGAVMIVKIGTIEIDGTTAKITAADAEMDEVFDYVKIDTECTLENAEVDNSQLGDGVIFTGISEPTRDNHPDSSLSMGFSAGYDFVDADLPVDGPFSITFTGSLEFSAEISLEYYLSLTYVHIKTEITVGVSLSGSVSAEIDLLDIPLGYFSFMPIPGVSIGIQPRILLKISGSFEVTITAQTVIGKELTIEPFKEPDLKNISKPAELVGEIGFEGEAFFGVAIEPNISIISPDVASIGISGETGLEISASMKVSHSTAEEEENKHLCKQCVAGEIVRKMEVNVNASILKKWKIEKTIFSYSKKFNDFYWSVDYQEFGWGECPHIVRTSGTCGENLKWSFDEVTDALTITGNGSMVDGEPKYDSIYCFMGYFVPWNDFCEQIKVVSLPNGLTSIGRSAFENCVNLSNITIPGSVKSIGDNAFNNCSILASVTVPNSVTNIGDRAFGDCSNLTNVTIGSSVTNIGYFAFIYCSSLKSVTIGRNVEIIGDYAFCDCYDLSDVWYTGTEADWNGISIGYGNDDLLNATIHFNSTGSESCMINEIASCESKTRAVIHGGTDTKDGELHSTDFSDLIPGSRYILVVSADESDPLNGKNLLYIDEAVSDESGSISFSYLPKEEIIDPYLCLYGKDRQPTDPCEGYTDIDRKAWYHTAADFVLERGLMGSTKTDRLTFEPNTKVSRAMVASILYTMAGKPEASYKGTFTDVPAGKWFTTAIEWCAQNGLASGKGNGKFDPNGNVTRQELAVFMMQMAAYLGKDTSGRADLGGFADASKVPAWAKTYVRWAVDAGLISGKASGGKTYLAPADTATRAELAAIIRSFVQNIAEAD